MKTALVGGGGGFHRFATAFKILKREGLGFVLWI